MPVVIAGAVCAPVTSAAAVTNISPPTISDSSGGLYTVGTSVTFTFTDDGTPAPVAYQYTVDGGATHTVPAPSGTASADFVPFRQHSRLIAYAVAADGTVSGGTVDDLYATAATPAADKDLNGDGLPDLLTVGTTSGLGPGLWQATGSPSGAAAPAG